MEDLRLDLMDVENRAEWRRRTRVADPSPEGFNPAWRRDYRLLSSSNSIKSVKFLQLLSFLSCCSSHTVLFAFARSVVTAISRLDLKSHQLQQRESQHQSTLYSAFFCTLLTYLLHHSELSSSSSDLQHPLICSFYGLQVSWIFVMSTCTLTIFTPW